MLQPGAPCHSFQRCHTVRAMSQHIHTVIPREQLHYSDQDCCSEVLYWKIYNDSVVAHKSVKMPYSSLTILFTMPSVCNRVSTILSKLFLMPTRTLNILSYPRRSTFAASVCADHRVQLRDFTVEVNSNWDKIFQRCVDVLKNAYMFWRRSKNVVASGMQFADSLLSRLSKRSKHGTKSVTEQSHGSNALTPSYFLPYCRRCCMTVHNISWYQYQLVPEMNWVIRILNAVSQPLTTRTICRSKYSNFYIKNSFPWGRRLIASLRSATDCINRTSAQSKHQKVWSTMSNTALSQAKVEPRPGHCPLLEAGHCKP